MLAVMTYNLGEFDSDFPLPSSVRADFRPGCDRAAWRIFGPFNALSV
jgi:hypothetical protein